jgi:hypothetical protein
MNEAFKKLQLLHRLGGEGCPFYRVTLLGFIAMADASSSRLLWSWEEGAWE